MFLVVTYLRLNVQSLKRVHTFHAEISEPIKNYFHNKRNQPHQEFGGGYIFVKKLWCLRAAGD